MKMFALLAIALAAGSCAHAQAQQGAALVIANWGTGVPGAVATWPGPPLEAGSTDTIVVGLHNSGYGEDNSPVTLVLDMPVGVTYRHITNAIPGFTCTTQMQGGREVVTCTTPYMYDGQDGFIAMAIDAAPDIAVPGPAEFHVAVGNDMQAPPSDCSLDPHQVGCGRLTWAMRPARVAALQFASAQHNPAWFTVGQAGMVQLGLANAGEGNAAATTVVLRLPPGFAFASSANSLPAMNCSVDGDSATGQTVACTGFGLPGGSTGSLVLHLAIGAQTEVPGPVVVLAAIDESSPATTETLLACADDPEQPQCTWLEIPTFAPCAAQYADGIYCDGFEWLHPPSTRSP